MKLRVAASLRSGAHAQDAGPSGKCSSGGGGARGRGGAEPDAHLFRCSYCSFLACSLIDLLLHYFTDSFHIVFTRTYMVPGPVLGTGD